MVDEIVFWLICAIAAARGGRFLVGAPSPATVTAHTDLHRERPRQASEPGPPASLGPGGLTGTHPNKSHWCPAFL